MSRCFCSQPNQAGSSKDQEFNKERKINLCFFMPVVMTQIVASSKDINRFLDLNQHNNSFLFEIII